MLGVGSRRWKTLWKGFFKRKGDAVVAENVGIARAVMIMRRPISTVSGQGPNLGKGNAVLTGNMAWPWAASRRG